MNTLSEQAIVNIIAQEMALPAANVWIANQNKTIPNDGGLYVSVGFSDGFVIGSAREDIATDDGMTEIQQLVTQESIQIDIFSASITALMRRWEIILALRSVYCQQIQELNNFRIFRIPRTFVNTSGAEGPRQINRFTAIVVCHSWQRKSQEIPLVYGDYYIDFNQRVDHESAVLVVDGGDGEEVYNTNG